MDSMSEAKFPDGVGQFVKTGWEVGLMAFLDIFAADESDASLVNPLTGGGHVVDQFQQGVGDYRIRPPRHLVVPI